MNTFDYVKDYFEKQNKINHSLSLSAIMSALRLIERAYRGQRQLFLIGNGGSASTASHIACDFQKFILGYKGKRPVPRFRALALTDNVEVMTAWANDVGYEAIFSEQLKNLAKKGDLLLAISASGNSPNVIEAVKTAQVQGLKVIGLTGFSGGKLRHLADVSVHVAVSDYGLVENTHLAFGHLAARYLLALR